MDWQNLKISLSPTEMFDHRLAALMGRTIFETKSSMGNCEYLSWQRYWNQEPWGAWRDNIHAAVIAREVRRPQLRRGSESKLDDFMVVNPAVRKRELKEKAFSLFEALAGPRNGQK